MGVQRNKGITFRYRQIRGICAVANNPEARSMSPLDESSFLGPDVISWGIVDKFETNSTSGEIVHYFKWILGEFVGSDGPLGPPQFRAVLSTTTGSFTASLQVFSASTLLFTLTSSNTAPTVVSRSIALDPSDVIWEIKLASQNSNARAILGGVSIFMTGGL